MKAVYLHPLLHELLTAHRIELIDRCREKAAKRLAAGTAPIGLEHGVPLFLDQIIKTLEIEQTADPMRSRSVSGPSGGGPSTSEVRAAATLHGAELLKGGYSVDQVVHYYGDLCQAITDLAFERRSPIEVDEFRTLNRCLDNGIADAVTEFASQRDSVMSAQSVLALHEQLGSLAHDLRDLTHTAMLAVAAIKTGNVGVTGATGALLDRSLDGLRRRIDRALAESRASVGLPRALQKVSLTDFVAVIKTSASLDALAAECVLTVAVEEGLEIQGDRDLLLTAVENLLHNAFKFTKRHTEVSLNVYAAEIASSSMSRIIVAAFHREPTKSCSCRSSRATRIVLVSGSGCPSAGATSRQTMEYSEFATSQAQGAFSRSTCLVAFRPARSPGLVGMPYQTMNAALKAIAPPRCAGNRLLGASARSGIPPRPLASCGRRLGRRSGTRDCRTRI